MPHGEASQRSGHGPHRLDPPGRLAPPWTTCQWFNTNEPLSLDRLRGSVVVLHAFQMLCPACVHHGLPQAQRVDAAFAASGVVVVGLHTVFEHHAAMTPVALQAFLHEYRIGFAVGVDEPSTDARQPIPVTMQAYGMRGTPSLVLIDRKGCLRLHAFGATDDLSLGAAVAILLAEGG
ncbi:MAG: redoxin domain-containing protein [Rubrivivax sp.]|nr:redoxin domain-containing protein [Rubrivivax sp.]